VRNLEIDIGYVLRTRKEVRAAGLHNVSIALTSIHLSLFHVQALGDWALFSGTFSPLFVMFSTANSIRARRYEARTPAQPFDDLPLKSQSSVVARSSSPFLAAI
jgi:hypothetical protein